MSSANKPATYRSTFAFSAGFLLLISVLSWLSIFLPVNHAIYDRFLTLGSPNTDKSVLMVNIAPDSDFQGGEQWRELLEQLFDRGAKAVVLLSQTEGDESWLQDYKDKRELIVASQLRVNELGEYSPMLPSRSAYISPPVKLAYAYRQWLPVVNGANGLVYEGFQRRLTGSALIEPLNINYWATGLIPEISVDRLLDFGLIKELVQGKVVLVGDAPTAGVPGYSVPINEYADGLSELHIQAYITHSVLSDKGLLYLPTIQALLFSTLILFVFVACLLWVLPRQTIPVSLLFFIVFLSLTCLAAVRWQLLLPITEVLLVLFGVLLYLINQRYRNERQLVSELVAEAHAMLAEKIVPQPLLVSDERWQRMMVFVGQQLLISRSVFLELDEGSNRLKIAQFYNSSAKDIEERRRDYGRSPYVEARNAGVPVKSVKRLFFKLNPDEEEWIVPLYYAGILLGFWVVTVTSKSYESVKNLTAIMNDISERISELLFHSSKVSVGDRRSGLRRQLTNIDRVSHIQGQVKSVFKSVFTRMNVLENISKHSSTASGMYSLFGNLLYANLQFEDIARALKIDIYKNSVIDILTQVSELDMVTAGSYLFEVLHHEERLEIPMEQKVRGRQYAIRIMPLHIEAEQWQGEAGSANRPTGVILELIDISSSKESSELEQDRLHYFSDNLRLKLLSIWRRDYDLEGAADESDELKLERDRHNEQMAKTLEAIEKVSSGFELKKRETEPQNICKTVQRVLEKNEDDLARRQLTFSLKKPVISPLVWAKDQDLKNLLQSAVNLLCDDALVNTDISIEISEFWDGDSRGAKINLSNKGYGIPGEEFEKIAQKLIGGEISAESHSSLRRFLERKSTVENWADIDISTALGRGYQIQISLEGFSINNLTAGSQK
ncbi:hypothetical protein [Zhongshania sp.]|uniref:hypothetical protein n=1 Tax=Zhongshania sp. TaxID=1971902 RepID=UPI00356B1B03